MSRVILVNIPDNKEALYINGDLYWIPIGSQTS